MKMNEIYEAPAVEIVKVMIEKGFAGSPSYSDGGVGLPGDGSDYDDLK